MTSSIAAWVLIVGIYSPGGDFIEKHDFPNYKTKADCYEAKQQLPRDGQAMFGLVYRGVCVSAEHYLGKKQDIGVPYD